MRRSEGFTITELLIALAVIGIAFGALAYSQLNNLKASSRSRLTTTVKAEANRLLEAKMAEMLKVIEDDDADWDGDTYLDQTITDPDTGAILEKRSFKFIDYYYSCPTVTNPPPELRGASASNLRSVECSGSQAGEQITNEWSVGREGGIAGEGSLLVTVSSSHDAGPALTMVSRITCYDVYPSPTADAPKPCPVPVTP